MGLVNRVFPKDAFQAEVNSFVDALTALSPPVLRLTKRAVGFGATESPERALRASERLYLDEVMKLEDAREGLAAFMEKRTPVWKGA